MSLPGTLCEFLDELDRVYIPKEAREDGGLIAGARAARELIVSP